MPEEPRNKRLIVGWKILFRHLLERRNEVILISVLGIFSGLAGGFVPFIVGKFFDALIEPTHIVSIGAMTLSIWVVLSIWLVIQVIANSMDWIIDTKRRHMGTFLRAEHVARSTASALRLPISLFKDEKIGEIIDRIQRSSNAIATITEQVVIELAPQFLSVFIGITIAFIIHPILAGLLLAGVTVYIITLIRIVPPIVVMQREGQKAWRTAWGNMGDAIMNFQTVKQSSAEEYESQRLWDKFVNKAGVTWNKIERIWTGINFYQRIIVVLTQLLIFIISVIFIGRGELTVGELIALNGYALLVFGPFARLGNLWQIIQNGLISIEQTDAMLQLPSENYDGTKEKREGNLGGAVEFKNVNFSYEDNSDLVLRDLSFSVDKGEVVALVGESGVGKSTTIELISGYYLADEGEVLIDGLNIGDMGVRHLRKNIAVVPQEPVLFNDSIFINIAYGKENASKEEVIEASKKAHAHEFIEKFPNKYDQLVGERGIKLSVGQKQRIAIARAILRNPSILILDEPTSALDAKTEKFITESLEKLMKGRTTFIIAHRLSTVRRANKILVFEKGKIVERGTHDDLIKRKDGVYRRLYDYQIGLK